MKTFLMAILLVLAALIPQAVAQQSNADWLKELDGTKFLYIFTDPYDGERIPMTISIRGSQAIDTWLWIGEQQVVGPMDIHGNTFEDCNVIRGKNVCIVYTIASSGIAITKTMPDGQKRVYIRQ